MDQPIVASVINSTDNTTPQPPTSASQSPIHSDDQPDNTTLSPQDTIEMPMTSISRIIRTALPTNIMISKEVKTSLAKSAGIFILYITSYANDSCRTGRRTTVTANDVLNAVKESELQQFLPALNHF
jgi:histone H3/H4